MKHDRLVTIILLVIFAVSQAAGLFLVAKALEGITCDSADPTSCALDYGTTAVGERPETTGMGSLLYIVIGVAIGTVFLLVIAKYQKATLWRVWFFLAVWMSCAIALGVLMHLIIAWIVALVLAAWKLWRPNIVVYNIAEVLMYAGIAVLLVPILDVWWALALLILVSIYDAYAVWRSGHMVTMAKFISSSNAFAGLVVPYQVVEEKKGKRSAKGGVAKDALPPKGKVLLSLPRSEGEASAALESGAVRKNAILGGGDITFPLLFAGAVLQGRLAALVASGIPLAQALPSAFLVASLVSLGAFAGIAFLFFFAKKDRFYPAMPFVTAGCLLGWAVTFLI